MFKATGNALFESDFFDARINIIQSFTSSAFFTTSYDNLGIPPMSNTAKNILPPQEFDPAAGLDGYFGTIHTRSI